MREKYHASNLYIYTQTHKQTQVICCFLSKAMKEWNAIKKLENNDVIATQRFVCVCVMCVMCVLRIVS